MTRRNNLPKGVRQRPDGSFEYRHYWGQGAASAIASKYREQLPDMPASFWTPGQRSEATADTLSIIKKAREQVRGAIHSGTYVPRRIAEELAKREAETAREEAARLSVTFEQVVREYLEFVGGHVVSSTVRSYRSKHNQAFPPLHDLPIASITPHTVEAWLLDLREDRSPRYVYNAYKTLNQVMKYASGEDDRVSHSFTAYIDKNPCVLNIGPRPKPEKERRVLTPEEVHALAEGMPPNRVIAIWLGALGGLRQGELLGLQRKHVSFDRGRVWIEVKQQLRREEGQPSQLKEPKTDAGVRRVPLMSMEGVDTFELFSDWMTNVVAPGENAFVLPLRPGKPAGVKHTAIGDDIKAARESASHKLGVNLSGVGSHDLRHTAMTNFGRLGATLSDLMKFGGHNTVDAVMIYQHSDAESLARVADRSMLTELRKAND